MVAFERVLKAFPHDYKPAPTYGDAFSHKWGLAYSQFCLAHFCVAQKCAKNRNLSVLSHLLDSLKLFLEMKDNGHGIFYNGGEK